MIASVVVLGAIMSILDTTVVNVAINTLARDFDTDALDDPVDRHRLHAGARDRHPDHRLGRRSLRHQAPLHALDRPVRRRLRAVAALAWSAESLIAFRVLQGLGGGMLMPAGMTILTRAAGPQRVGRVMAIIGVPMLLGPILGPILGGWLVDDVSWRWIFFINLPIGIAALVASLRILAEGLAAARRALRRARARAALARASR